MPICAKAAWMRYSPRLGFCCKRLIASMAFSVTFLTPGGRPWGLSSRPSAPCCGPPLEDPVNGGLVYAQVSGDGLRGPSLGVERNHRQPALAALWDLMVWRKAPRDPQGDRLFGQDAPDGLMVGSPAEEYVACVCDLVEVEAGVFRFEIDDEAAHRGREPADSGTLGAEEALHAFRLEVPRLALQGPLGSRARLLCAFGGRRAEQDERAYEFVVPLLWPQA